MYVLVWGCGEEPGASPGPNHIHKHFVSSEGWCSLTALVWLCVANCGYHFGTIQLLTQLKAHLDALLPGIGSMHVAQQKDAESVCANLLVLLNLSRHLCILPTVAVPTYFGFVKRIRKN